MTDITKILPTKEMQEEFEQFKNMSPEERAMFQEERAHKMEAMSDKKQQAFKQATHEGLTAIQEELFGFKARVEQGEMVDSDGCPLLHPV